VNTQTGGSATTPARRRLPGPDRACLLSEIERQNVRVIHCEASNFTDSVSWGNPGANMANQATFGVINSGEGGRGIQRGARAMF